MKQHAYLLILTIMSLISCSDDTEIMKQESSPPSLTEKAPAYRTKESVIIEVELSTKNNRNNTRNSSFPNYSINNEIYFYRDIIINQTYPSLYIANAEGGSGYAIVSANLYTTPIIAYLESDNLSLSGAPQYQELSFFSDLVRNYTSNNKKYEIEFKEENDDDNSLDTSQIRGRRRPIYIKKPGEWEETERV